MTNETRLDYRPLSALMQQLPQAGEWTPAHREKWIAAFIANLDMLITVKPKEDEDGKTKG